MKIPLLPFATGRHVKFFKFLLLYCLLFTIISCEKNEREFYMKEDSEITSLQDDKQTVLGLNKIDKEIRLSLNLHDYRYFKNPKGGEFWIVSLIKGNLGLESAKAFIYYEQGDLSVMVLSYIYDKKKYKRGNFSTYDGSIAIINENLEVRKVLRFANGRLIGIDVPGMPPTAQTLCVGCNENYNWCIEFPALCGWENEGGGGDGPDDQDGYDPPDQGGNGNPPQGLTLQDIMRYKNISTVIADMEVQAGITVNTFASRVYLGTSSHTIITATSFKIYIKQTATIQRAIFSYAHELNNAINHNALRTHLTNASNNPETPANRTAFADACAFIEAKGVYAQILVAIETSTLPLVMHTNTVVNAVVDVLNGTITMQAGINIIFQEIKNGNARDDDENDIYQHYLDIYDQLH